MKWNENDVWNIYKNPIIVQAVGLSSYNAKNRKQNTCGFLYLKYFS